MAVKPFEIKDQVTFKSTTGEPRQLAGLYFFYELDFLAELAHQIALDFFNRPGLFTDLADNKMAPILAKLHARYGSHEEFLNCQQRQGVFAPIFGSNSETQGDDKHETQNFRNVTGKLMDACTIFATAVFGNKPTLIDGVRQAQSNFHQYLDGLHGDSIRWSYKQALLILNEDSVYPIFRNKGVSARYGIGKTPIADWPFLPDANAGKLVEATSKALDWPADGNEMYKSMNNDILTMPYISFDLITNTQQVALKGARAIATAIEVDPNAAEPDIEILINRVYTWGKALESVREYSKNYRRSPDKVVPEQPRGGVALAQPLRTTMATK